MREAIVQTKWKYDLAMEDKQVSHTLDVLDHLALLPGVLEETHP